MKLRLLYEAPRRDTTKGLPGRETQGSFRSRSTERLTDPDELMGTINYMSPQQLQFKRGEAGKEADELLKNPYDPWSRVQLRPEEQIQSVLDYFKGKPLTFVEILDKLKPYLVKLSKAGHDMNYRNDYIAAINALVKRGVAAKGDGRPPKFRISHRDVAPSAPPRRESEAQRAKEHARKLLAKQETKPLPRYLRY